MMNEEWTEVRPGYFINMSAADIETNVKLHAGLQEVIDQMNEPEPEIMADADGLEIEYVTDDDGLDAEYETDEDMEAGRPMNLRPADTEERLRLEWMRRGGKF
jgi:hypothetical protein